jgi:hypothetical protein
MIELTFRDFFIYKYPSEEYYELYVMKNGLEEILYVGISSQNVWNRWFGPLGHILLNSRSVMGMSSVGQKIENHMPDSWGWKIQLWTLDDCVAFCADEINPRGEYTVKFLEPIMIQKLRPSLNVTYNLNPRADLTPKSEKEKRIEAELDKAYYEIFEKRTKPPSKQS